MRLTFIDLNIYIFELAIFISTIWKLLNHQCLPNAFPILFETDTLVIQQQQQQKIWTEVNVSISLFMESVNLNLTFIKLFKNKSNHTKFLIITFSRVPHPAFCCSFYTMYKKRRHNVTIMTMKFCFTFYTQKKKHNTPPDWIIFFMHQLDLAVMCIYCKSILKILSVPLHRVVSLIKKMLYFLHYNHSHFSPVAFYWIELKIQFYNLMYYTSSGLASQHFVDNKEKKKSLYIMYMEEILDELLHLNPRVYLIHTIVDNIAH